jgi:flagellar basal-body rod modification protein FlgD
MTSVGSTSATHSASLYTGTAGVTEPKGGDQLGKEAFLSLLVAQLKYQDPSNPTDSSQFMAQTAQFAMVEKMEAVVESQTQLLASSQVQAASALVGRSITWTEGDQTKTGVVSALAMTNGSPTLMVGEFRVPMTAITKVTAA